MIDYWTLAKDFAVGDYVQKYVPSRSGNISPYIGRVTSVLPAIGFLDVQWPFGNERVSPEELVRVNKEVSMFIPPMSTFSYYPGLEQERAKLASKMPWNTLLPIGLHEDIARQFHQGKGEVQAYDNLWHKYSSVVDDASLRKEVQSVYAFAENLTNAYLESAAHKTAMYWVSQNRTHRATKSEVSARCPSCPRCGSSMRKTTYKMSEGQRMKLFACPKDLYLIKQDDILGPSGEPVVW